MSHGVYALDLSLELMSREINGFPPTYVEKALAKLAYIYLDLFYKRPTNCFPDASKLLRKTQHIRIPIHFYTSEGLCLLTCQNSDYDSKTSAQLLNAVTCGLHNCVYWYMFVYMVWHMALVSPGHRHVLKIYSGTGLHYVVFVIEN